MANSAQARKRVRQNETARLHNSARRSEMRTYIKNVRAAIANGEKEAAMAAFKVAQSNMDNNVGKGQIHKNTAARLKSRLNAQIKALA